MGASGACTNGVSSTITIQLAAPIVHNGIYQITLVNGSDGNTLIDDCALQTPAGSFLNFAAVDTVSADFSYQLFQGCKADSISFSHDGRNGVNSWAWNLANGQTSSLQNPQAIYTVFGNKQVTLIVSNGVCSDSSSETVVLDNTLRADFESSSAVCPNDSAIYIDKSIGNVQN